MTTKMPQRPHPKTHREHGPRPYEEGAIPHGTNSGDSGSKPNAFPENHQGLKGVTESGNSNRDVGQYTGEGQPANMKK